MSGCYQIMGFIEDSAQSGVIDNFSNHYDPDSPYYDSSIRKKRNLILNSSVDFVNFCKRYAQLEKSKQCNVNKSVFIEQEIYYT
jgi:hypothetical protein